MTAIIVLSFYLIMIIACAFYLVRNQWVFHARVDLIHSDYDVYRLLPSYQTMMRRFWVWDAARFIGMPDVRETKKEQAKRRGNLIVARHLARGDHQ